MSETTTTEPAKGDWIGAEPSWPPATAGAALDYTLIYAQKAFERMMAGPGLIDGTEQERRDHIAVTSAFCHQFAFAHLLAAFMDAAPEAADAAAQHVMEMLDAGDELGPWIYEEGVHRGLVYDPQALAWMREHSFTARRRAASETADA